MKVSLNWLQDHLDLADQHAAALADRLTFAGVEVEGIHQTGASVPGVVVAEIAESIPHPNADKLSVCQVHDGTGTPRQIVCGAKNYRVGDKVPLALPGATLPDGHTIKDGKLRGVVSHGMMCSGAELGLSEDHAGLLILPADAPVGRPLSDVYASDTIFEVEITPNRPDLLSHLGVARELAALGEMPLKKRAHFADAKVRARTATKDEIDLEAAESCPFYTARRIRGIKVGPSPDWLRQKLEAVGLRPINNVVDVTNYVMLEMGQPLHAFDASKLEGGIRVRLARGGETILALDGESYTLESSDLVIADHAKAIAIGGVMGGEESAVTETTTDILLESAYFQPSGIRRTSRRLDLGSDSSYRFERGVDPHQTAGASELATALILELAGGEAEGELAVAGEVPPVPAPVALDLARCQSLLGTPLPPEIPQRILTRLGLTLAEAENGLWQIPTYRLDLTRPIDLVEEIARVYGIENVPARRLAIVAEPSAEDRRYDLLMRLRVQLTTLGFHESQTIKLVSGEQLGDDLCGLRTGGRHEAVELKNPLSQDHAFMRTALVPGLLQTAARNLSHGATSLKFFEIGTVFSKHPRSPRVQETLHLALLLSGDMEPVSWHATKPRPADLYDLIGVIQSLFTKRTEAPRIEKASSDSLLLAGEILRGKTALGRLGQLWPARVRAMDGLVPVFIAEIDLDQALRFGEEEAIQALSRYPAVTRDVALEAPADLPNAAIEAFFRDQQIPWLEDVRLFDVFADPTGAKLPADRKSLAYSLTYRSAERTLTSEEIDRVHGEVASALQKDLGLRIR